MRRPHDERLRDLVTDRGLVEPARADAAFEISESDGAPGFVELLATLGLLDEDRLVAMLTDATGWRVETTALVPTVDAASALPASAAEDFGVLPLRLADDGRLVVATCEPLLPETLDDLRFIVGRELAVVLATPSAVKAGRAERPVRAPRTSAPTGSSDDGDPFSDSDSFGDSFEADPSAVAEIDALIRDLDAAPRDDDAPEHDDTEPPPVVRLVTALFDDAVRREATHIHIDRTDESVRIRMRRRGRLIQEERAPLVMANPIFARLKIVAMLDVAERRLPQEGRFRLRGRGGDEVWAHVATLPTANGERAVIAIVEASRPPPTLAAMDAPDEIVAAVASLAAGKSGGLGLVGAADWRRSDELLRAIEAAVCEARPDGVVLGIAEGRPPAGPSGLIRVSPRAEIGLSRGSLLRAARRQDPDVLVVDLVTDRECLVECLDAARRGVAVVAALPARDGVAAIGRALDVGAPGDLLAELLRFSFVLHAVPRLCPHCRRPGRDGFEPVGCDGCDRGRSGEITLFPGLDHVTAELAAAIRRDDDRSALAAAARMSGACSLAARAAPLVATGEVARLDLADL